MYQAVSQGSCPLCVAHKRPGKMGHSRWLTTASRILRHYMSEEDSAVTLVQIATYIMKVYVPVWFAIKQQPCFTNGAKHLFKMLHSIQTLDHQSKAITNKVLQRNAFFAHPENLLVAMISDENLIIRQLGWRRIMKARSNKEENLRTFIVPDVNINANAYHEMINWQECELTEPPVTSKFSDNEIKTFITDGTLPSFPSFPCHTQAVERAIKLVTESSLAVSGNEQRHGFIHNRISSRSKMPKFNSKKDFNI